MNISSTSQADKIQENDVQSTSKQTSENDSQATFSEEYKRLLAQQGLNPNFVDNGQLLSMMNLSQLGEQKGTLSFADALHNSFNYDTRTISKEDALFFSAMVEKTDYIVNESGDKSSFQLNLLQVTNRERTQNTKSAEVSKVLMNLIEEAYKTQKPMRIDFDNNVSVILKISKDGKVSAEFIPGDKAVEKYLRDNIGFLKTSLTEQNIDYGDIMYKPYKNNSKNQQGRDNRNNGGSNKNE